MPHLARGCGWMFDFVLARWAGEGWPLKPFYPPDRWRSLSHRVMFSQSKKGHKEFPGVFFFFDHIFGFSIVLGDFLSQGVLDLAARLSPSRFETIQFFTWPKLGEMMNLICVKKTHVFLNGWEECFQSKEPRPL